MRMGSDRLRVVLVSPGDVAEERAAAKCVIEELNRGIAHNRLVLWRWETDSRPGLHPEGPQGLIDDLMDMPSADLVIGVFWQRFGTPTHDADSGTEHELRYALAEWREHGRPDVMVYFSDRPYTASTPAEARQRVRVLEFQEQLPNELLWWTYTKPLDFERLLREHVTRYLEPAKKARPEAVAAVSERVRFNTPVVAAAFTGREDELERVDTGLRTDERVVVTQAITGLGGVGKSQLAARYVQLHADEYEIVAWIAAQDGGVADLARLADHLRIVEDPNLAPADRAQRAIAWLSECEQTWLLVLDNIESADQLAALLPQGSAGRVLVTSRDRSLRQFGTVLTVDVFDEDTATRYLIERAGRPHDETAGRELAIALGCLPLALAHAGAYCTEGTGFGDYHRQLDGLPAPELFDIRPEVFYEQTVASTWRASIDAAMAVAPLAHDVIQLAAYLAPDAMPKTLFEVLVDNPDDIRDERRLTDALNALARYSLANVDDSTISVHRLLQKTVRDAVAARHDDAPGLRALAAVDERFPRDAELELPVRWPLCEQLLVHVDALAVTLGNDAEQGEQLVRLLNRASAYLYRAEAGRRGLATATTALRCAERLLSADHPDTLNARNNLGLAYDALGKIREALAIFEPLLPDRERIIGPAHPDTLQTRHNLAGAYQKSGGAKKAVELFEQLLAERAAIEGAEHPHTMRTRYCLANAYLDAGRPVDAIPVYEPLLADRERALGAEHPSTLNTRHGLATAYQEAGHVTDAIAIYEPLLTTQEKILGVKHHNTLQTRFSLAAAYLKAGRRSDAIATYELLLTDCVRIFGPEDTHTQSVRESLADAYEGVGRLADAQRLRDRRPS